VIRKLMILACAGMAATPALAAQDGDGAALGHLAERMVALQLNYDPALSYGSGLPVDDHRRWADRSPEAIRALERKQDMLLEKLNAIDARTVSVADRRTYAILKEMLESERQSRICKFELWAVGHMSGWQLELVRVAQAQPVRTADDRAQALERWSAVPRMVDQEITNLRAGLGIGYSAPKSVVVRVIKQVDGLATGALEKSPLLSPAQRSDDASFNMAYRKILADHVIAALVRYRDFLQRDYLPRARSELGVAANPDGVACYQASLRATTTLDRTAQKVYDVGAAAIARNLANAVERGQKLFGTRDLTQIIERVKAAPDNRFASEEEFIAFSRQMVDRARARTTPLFHAMPEQTVLVEPFHEFMRGSGASPHYERQPDLTKPAYYRIGSENWKTTTRGDAELTAVHEAYPGHHMQIAFGQTLPQTSLAKLSSNAAYVEGWARYSEVLAEEAGMFDNPYAPISRRIWPARGMVADPGLHVLGWSRKQTIDYLMNTGAFGSVVEAEDMVDRMASLPGQLTAYDSGGLEILALRDEAKTALGNRFDLRDFHKAVLGAGVVPLGELRIQIEQWVRSVKGR